jgi:uncharacterized protein (TIGR02271 family)
MVWNSTDPGRTSTDAEQIIVGLFAHASDARRALHALSEHHFTSDQIAAAFREQAPSRPEAETAPQRGSAKWFGQLRQMYHGEERREDIGQGETTPAAPNKFESMLSRLHISREYAVRLDRDLGQGGAIVTVNAGARNQEARSLLEQSGARMVHDTDPAPLAATETTSPAVVNSAPFVSPQQAEPGHIQLFGEVLRVHKEKVSSADVQVRKESITHLETVQVPVTREHLVVEHVGAHGREDAEHALRIPLSEERVHINKDTVLREEYKVGKREVTQNQSVTDTVRRERLLIDEAGVEKSK